MLRLSRFALPLLLAFAVTGFAPVDSPSADAVAAQAADYIIGSSSLPVCQSSTYTYTTSAPGYFRMVNGSGHATISTAGGGALSAGTYTVQVSGVSAGDVRLEYVSYSRGTVNALIDIAITPSSSNACDF